MNIYFDLETQGFDFSSDKIITIQYQELDYNGNPKGEIVILKEWESSEEEIVKRVYNELINKGDWNWILVGQNLIFDLTFLFEKFKKYNLTAPTLSDYLYKKPIIDLKYTLVMMNGLNFKGSGLHKMTNKKQDGRNIPQWYKMCDYPKIEEYITQETKSFTDFFSRLINELKEVKESGRLLL